MQVGNDEIRAPQTLALRGVAQGKDFVGGQCFHVGVSLLLAEQAQLP